MSGERRWWAGRRPRTLLDLSDLSWFLTFHAHRTGVPIVVAELGQRLLASGHAVAVQWRDADLCYRTVAPAAARDLLTGAEGLRAADLERPVTFGEGDVLCLLGSWWSVPGLHLGLGQAQRGGARVLSLVHDLAPLLDSDAAAGEMRATFADYLAVTDLAVDRVVFNSEASRARWVRERGAADAGWQVGRGIGLASRFTGAEQARGDRSRPYVLMVSALHPWKRQHEVVALWEGLAAELGPACPELLLVGPPTDDGAVRAALTARPAIAPLVHRLGAVDDEELVALYRGAMFSLFLAPMPDGWGLPITESLTFGCPVIAADTPPLRESGGHLARFVPPAGRADAQQPDPDDPAHRALAAAIRALIVDEQDRSALAHRIRREYRPPTWDAVANRLAQEVRAVNRARTRSRRPGSPLWVPALGEELPLRRDAHLPLTGAPSTHAAEARARLWVAAHRDQWVAGGVALLPGRGLTIAVPGIEQWPAAGLSVGDPITVVVSTVPTGGTATVTVDPDGRCLTVSHGQSLLLHTTVSEGGGAVGLHCRTSITPQSPEVDSALFCSTVQYRTGEMATAG